MGKNSVAETADDAEYRQVQNQVAVIRDVFSVLISDNQCSPFWRVIALLSSRVSSLFLVAPRQVLDRSRRMCARATPQIIFIIKSVIYI